jgi:UDP-N-acetylmuramate dehydrogenase
MDTLIKELKKYGQVKSAQLLSRHTTMKIGGPAKYFVIVNQTDNLVDLLNFLAGEGIEFQIIGGGSNVLFGDEGFAGVVIKIETSKYFVEDSEITAEAGVSLGALINLATKNSLSGLEWASGIPGTVGGAVRGNAGAYGEEMSSSIKEVEVWRDGQIVLLEPKDCGFDYRTSVFKSNNNVILRVKIILKKDDPIQIAKKINDLYIERQNKLPNQPSSGSFFKNIKISDWPGDKSELPQSFVERGMIPAGWLIEQCGLKGLKLGEAGISEKHGNFIINYGEASIDNILSIVDKVVGEVYNKYEITLEPEVEIIKN